MKCIGNYSDKHVCVLGLGYVGLTLAVAMADVGFNVLGVEIRDEVIDLLMSGKAHFHEPGLENRLQQVKASGNFSVSKSIPQNWQGSVYIITVGTPLNSEGRSRLDMIENVSKQVSNSLKTGDLVVMRSTVKLGVTRKVVMPVLDKAGCNYELAFCPERTLEGRALAELRELPQIVGGLTYRAGVRASQMFQFLTPTVVRVSDIETAEMIKLIDNAQRDVAFAYANEVAQACDAIGISAAEVIRAGKLGYPRTNLPMPGLVGGPCLEKDSHILAEGLLEKGYEPKITKVARSLNEIQPSVVIDYVKSVFDSLEGFSGKPKIALLGLAFKGRPATDDLRGTMARPILDALKRNFPEGSFVGYDPVVSNVDLVKFGIEPVQTIEDAFVNSSLIFILNNHPVFEELNLAKLIGIMNNPGLVYDFWNLFDVSTLHLPIGRGYMALGSHGRAILP